jgi:hypothetical protein
MKSLIVGLLCILALQGCAASHGTSFDTPLEPIVTMTPGSWR